MGGVDETPHWDRGTTRIKEDMTLPCAKCLWFVAQSYLHRRRFPEGQEFMVDDGAWFPKWWRQFTEAPCPSGV